ncbi:hypothetical protein COFR110785_10435 [Corynebacterium frankenforstense]
MAGRGIERVVDGDPADGAVAVGRGHRGGDSVAELLAGAAVVGAGGLAGGELLVLGVHRDRVVPAAPGLRVGGGHGHDERLGHRPVLLRRGAGLFGDVVEPQGQVGEDCYAVLSGGGLVRLAQAPRFRGVGDEVGRREALGLPPAVGGGQIHPVDAAGLEDGAGGGFLRRGLAAALRIAVLGERVAEGLGDPQLTGARGVDEGRVAAGRRSGRRRGRDEQCEQDRGDGDDGEECRHRAPRARAVSSHAVSPPRRSSARHRRRASCGPARRGRR